MELIINNVKLEGDVMDADFIEKFEISMRKMHDAALESKTKHFETIADNYRAQCDIVNTCFDDIFGAGTAAKLFGGKANVREHLLAIDAVGKWSAAERKALNDLTNRYTQRQQAAINQPVQIVSHKHGQGKGKRH